MDELKYWLALNRAPGIGPKRFQLLREHFGSMRTVWEAAPPELAKVKNIGLGVANGIAAFRRQTDPDRELALLERYRARVVTTAATEYPELLRHIYDPPPVLYFRGELRPEDGTALAIVGTRVASEYGKTVASLLARELAGRGITVVSGMARGIDTAAHLGAMEAGGRTFAVLGCGLDTVYPAENRAVMARIAAAGAVISPFPFGTKPEAGNFPARNRLISGLSLGTVVVEAQERSGALITADFALEQGREVFAVPGNITSKNSRGTNYLLKQGAKLVESLADILEELPRLNRTAPLSDRSSPAAGAVSSVAAAGLTAEETQVLQCVTDDPLHIDQIVQKCRLVSDRVAAVLMYLELKGLVRRLPGQLFRRSEV
ncbi:MAG: DNA-processing protein DprA [bacterium]